MLLFGLFISLIFTRAGAPLPSDHQVYLPVFEGRARCTIPWTQSHEFPDGMSYQFSSHLTRVQVDLSPTAYALGWRCEPLPSDRRPGTEAKCQPVQIVRTPDRADIAFDLIIPGFPEVPPGEGMPEMYQCCRPQAIQAIIVGWPDRLITEGPCRYELLCEATSPPGMPPKPDFCALFYAPPVRYRCESQLTDLGFCLFSVDR